MMLKGYRRGQRFALPKGRESKLVLPGTKVKLKNKVQEEIKSLIERGPAGTKADSDVQPMLQCLALTFGNALLAEVLSHKL